MVWLIVLLELPQPSTALHVCVSVYDPAELPAIVTSLTKITVAVVHASLAVGAVNDAVPVHSIVILAPCPPIVGGVVSPKEIVWLTVLLELPQPSTALHVFVWVYDPAQLPAVVTSLTKITVAFVHASLAVGAVNDAVPVHSIVMFAPCPPIVGGVVSRNGIACFTVLVELQQPSTALHVFVSVYDPAQLPAVLTSLTKITVAFVHASDAVGAVNDAVPVHSIVMFAPCPPIVGGVVSPNEIV